MCIFLQQPLDDFCRVMHREIQKIMGRKIISTESWLMSPANRPLAPACAKNAIELSRLPPDDLRSLMKRNPIEIRKYFQNQAFVNDEPSVGKKTEADVEASPSPPSQHKSSKSDLASGSGKDEDETADSISKKSKEDEDDDEEEEEEDEPSEPADVSSKRVSFALPDEDDEQEEDEKEIEDEEVEEGVEEGEEDVKGKKPKQADGEESD